MAKTDKQTTTMLKKKPTKVIWILTKRRCFYCKFKKWTNLFFYYNHKEIYIDIGIHLLIYRLDTIRHNVFRWWIRTLLPHQPPPFFAGNGRPQGLPGVSRGKEIQQRLPRDPDGTDPTFLSLFDPERNIPFYSAYKVTPQQAPLIGTYTRKEVKARWRNPPGELRW